MSILTQGHFLIYGYNNFTQKGYKKASKAKDWEDINSFDLTGKSFMITGANSGLGLSASKYFASRGGTVHMICRSKEKGEKARDDIISITKNTNVHLHLCDVAKPSDIRTCFEKFEKEGHNLDVLVNNAGVMLDTKNNTPDGLDETFATNTLSTFLFTVLALPILKNSKSPRVIIVSSGGALTEPLITREEYDKQPKQWVGRTAYARTKRHQMVLTELFAEKFTKSTGIGFYAMHPGWADTPAVATSMPDFYKTFYKVLRTADEGSDTMWWLGATSKIDPQKMSGEFFRDRAPEISHFWLGSTKYTKPQAEDLWKWCCETGKWSEDELKGKL